MPTSTTDAAAPESGLALRTDGLRPVGEGLLDPVDGLVGGPHPARVHNCLLGGKDHYQRDDEVVAALRRASPGFAGSIRAGRRFMVRVVRHLAAERGLTQFLDVGAGLPLGPDLHEVVQQVRPAARVVYVDHDPLIMAHIRALTAGSASGLTAGLQGDLLRPDGILTGPELVRAVDVGEPIAITLLAVLHAVPDDDEVRRSVEGLLAPFPRGSALAICTLCSDGAAGETEAVERVCLRHAMPAHHRSWNRIRALFSGLVLEQPGVVPVQRWRPGPADRAVWDQRITMVGGVAIKP